MAKDILENELEALERRLAAIVTLCERLQAENTLLQDQQQELVDERSRLIEKNETARSKVEQMIVRLKSLEVGQ